jgi:hypothetical protein
LKGDATSAIDPLARVQIRIAWIFCGYFAMEISIGISLDPIHGGMRISRAGI